MTRLLESEVAGVDGGDTRILPLVAEPGNRRFLIDWIGEQDGYRLVDPSTSIETAGFDVCVMDRGSLRKHADELRARKRAADPVLLPYLLLLPAGAAGLLDREADGGLSTAVTELVDEVVRIPIRRAELDWRLRGVLRMRRQSLELDTREREVRETANRLRSVIEACPDAIVVVDDAGRVQEWNPAAERIFGWTREEIIGEPNPIVPSDKHGEFSALVADALDGGRRRGVETHRVTKDGDGIEISLSTAPVYGPSDEVVGAMGVIEDRSETVDRERRLRRFHEAINATNHAVYITDPDGVIQYVNPAFERITGYSAEEAIGATPRIMASGQQDSAYYAALWETIAAGETWEEEIVNQRKSGETYYADQTIVPILDGDDDVEAYVAIQRDITDSKARDARFKAVIEHSSDVITVLDESGGIEYVSPSIQRVLGYAPGELEGESAFELVHPDDSERVIEAFAELTTAPEHETVIVEYRARHADGSWRWAESVATKRHELPSGAFVINTRDITRRIERERALVEMEETRSLALAASNAGIWEWALDDDTVSIDSACEQLLDIEPGSFDGSLPAVLDRIHPDDRPDLASALEQAIAASGEARLTVRIGRGTGTDRWVDCRAETVATDDGPPDRVIGVFVDVTDRQERIKQLQVLDRVLRHNLRNDLNVIQGYTEALESAEDGEADTFLERIREQCRGLLSTMEKSRSITKALAAESTAIRADVMSVVDRVVGQARTRHPGASITVAGPETAAARITERFERALEEVVENAIVHNDRTVPAVDIAVTTQNQTVTIRVADDGPGIPEMDRNVVTGAHEIDPLYHGSGLGLWMVSWVIGRGGGSVAFEENEPRGTVVTIDLAAADPEAMDDGD